MSQFVLIRKSRYETRTEFIGAYPYAVPAIQKVGGHFAFLNTNYVANLSICGGRWDRVRDFHVKRWTNSAETPVNDLLLESGLNVDAREAIYATVCAGGACTDDHETAERIRER